MSHEPFHDRRAEEAAERNDAVHKKLREKLAEAFPNLPTGYHYCAGCGVGLPVDHAELIERIAALEAERDQLKIAIDAATEIVCDQTALITAVTNDRDREKARAEAAGAVFVSERKHAERLERLVMMSYGPVDPVERLVAANADLAARAESLAADRDRQRRRERVMAGDRRHCTVCGTAYTYGEPCDGGADDRARLAARVGVLESLLRRGYEAIDWGGDSALLRDVDAALSADAGREVGDG